MKKFILLTFVIFFSAGIFAANYLVVSVSDLTTKLTSAQPGDTFFLKNGKWSNASIVFKCNGNTTKPIVLAAQTMGQVFLEGTSKISIAGNYLVVTGLTFQNGSVGTSHVVEFRGSTPSTNCRLTNCAFIKYNSSLSTDNKWVSLYGQYNRVDHCYFEGKNNLGATITVWYTSVTYPNPALPTYHIIDHNYFLNRSITSATNGGESIRIGDSNTSRTKGYNIVEFNYFSGCDGEIEIISNKSEYNTYRYNTFYNNDGGLTLRHGANCTVIGNFFFGGTKSGSYGVRLIDENHIVMNNYMEGLKGGGSSNLRSPITIMNGIPNSPANGYFQVKNSVVAFNTIINCNGPAINIGAKKTDATLVPTNCKVSNNLVKNSTPVVQHESTPSNMTYEGNIYNASTLGITSTGWKDVDPKIVYNTSDLLWRLTSTSLAINASVGDYSILEDMDGQLRTGIKDVGSDEYLNSEIKVKPLTSNDVGPCWMRSSGCNLITLDNTTELKLDKMLVYPNPSNGVFYIQNEIFLSKDFNIECFDIMGRNIPIENIKEQTTLKIELKPISGIYFLKVRIGLRVYTIPLIIK